MTTDTLEAGPTVAASHEVEPNRLALDSAASRLFLRFLYRAPVGHTMADLLRGAYWNEGRKFGIDAWSEIHAIVAPDGEPEGATVCRLMVIAAPKRQDQDVEIGLIDQHRVTRAGKGG